MHELLDASASQLLIKLQRKQISSRELLDAFMARVAERDGALNALVVRTFDQARERALAADEARAHGEHWGPLHGLPMTVKEAFNLAGTPTTWGFEKHRHNVVHSNAVAVQRLLNAGAIVFGKTNVPVALGDWQTFNPIYGTTNNPWDLSRGPGGSSGGAAAALAAGMTALELGSDIGSSIRNPAHYCGVWGHKPTWGVVPQEGHQLPGEVRVDATDIGVAGPMAKSAYDLTLAMQVLTTPLQAFGPLGWGPAQWRDAGVPAQRLRIGIMPTDEIAPTASAVRKPIEALAEHLIAKGFDVQVLSRPEQKPVPSQEAWAVYIGLLRGTTGAALDETGYAAALKEAAALAPGQDDYPAWHWRGSTMSHRAWHQWEQRRAVLRGQWAEFFTRFDLLICPVGTTPAFAHNQKGWRWERMLDVDGQAQPTTKALFWAGYASLCGLPATAVPLGQSPEGLPVGAQIIGPVFGDTVCLRMARWLEENWRGFVAPPWPPKA